MVETDERERERSLALLFACAITYLPASCPLSRLPWWKMYRKAMEERVGLTDIRTAGGNPRLGKLCLREGCEVMVEER